MSTFQRRAYCICAVSRSTGVFGATRIKNESSKLSSSPSHARRYFAICRPLEYPLYMTKKTVGMMIANVWFLPALISFTPIFLGWYTTNDHLEWLKKNPNECIFVVNKIYAVVSSSISFWIPGIVMITMYYRIFK